MNKDKKIILVEDDDFLRELASKKIAEAGYDIKTASTGEEGMQKIEEEEFDLILLDLILPGMGGFEILEKVNNHKDKRISNTPVIILSNLGQEDEVKKAKNMGANDYLIKAHFTPASIAKKINEYI
ncbi:MAG: response regulator [Patescibacteria group bacterium]